MFCTEDDPDLVMDDQVISRARLRIKSWTPRFTGVDGWKCSCGRPGTEAWTTKLWSYRNRWKNNTDDCREAMDDPKNSRARLDMQSCTPRYRGVDDQVMVVHQTVKRKRVKNFPKRNSNEKLLWI